jgi:membrane protease YdiL (CAAX protease family)
MEAQLVILGVLWLVAWRPYLTARRRLPASRSFEDVPWHGLDLILFALAFFAFHGTSALLIVGGDLPRVSRDSPWFLAADRLAQVIGTLAVLALVFVGRRIRPAHMGFGSRTVRTELVWAVSAYLLFLPVVLFSFQVSSWLLERLGQRVEPQELVRLFVERLRPGSGEETDAFLLPLFVFFTVILGPLCEEILFRVILYSGFRRVLAPVPAVLLSSYIFALFHTVSTLIPIFVLALLLGALYERTRSLPAVFAVHALHNGIMVCGMLLLPV